MKRFFHSFVEPRNTVYLLAHLVLFVAGFLIVVLSETALAQGVGSSLIATAIAGWVIFVYVLTGKTVRERLDVLEKLGVVSGSIRRGAAIRHEYDVRIERTHREIDVLGFGLRSLREDFRTDFAAWKQKARVRILLLDPEFPTDEASIAGQRDIEERSGAGVIAGDVRQFIAETRELLDERFQIRLYRCLPTVNIFRADDELFWGPYLIGHASRNSPTLVVRSGGELFEVFRRHFDEIWDHHSRAPNLQ